MQCQSKTRNGVPCQARALVEGNYCAFHNDPGRAAELGSKGGRRRAVYNGDDLKDFEAPKTAADLRDLLAQSIVEIRAGKLDPKLANSISYLGTSFLRALEISDIEARIGVLEAHQKAAEEEAQRNAEAEPGNNVYTELFKKIRARKEEEANGGASAPEETRES